MKEDNLFSQLGLSEKALEAIKRKGFIEPSPIQKLTIPLLLEENVHVIARARTGTGKTAAFGLPLVEKISEDKGHVQALVLTPTRELALQVKEEIESFTEGRYPRLQAVYGGAGMREQLMALRRGVEIVVGTPGRVQDHLNRGTLDVSQVEFFILDEADEMLDMGFIDDIEEIFENVNKSARVLLFSATMPREIIRTAEKFMGDYKIVEETVSSEIPVLTTQKYWVVKESEKIAALMRLIDISPDFYGIVFTQTKVDADTVAKALDERGYEAVSLHGDIVQSQREKILQRFKRRKTKIVVATDVAARGIDIENLTHVVNFSLPNDTETYIHRIGRTGRAGREGAAFTFVTPSERKRIQRFLRASKGQLEAAKVPTVDEVLSVKRDRLFTEKIHVLKEFFPQETESSLEDFPQEAPKKIDDIFEKLADQLCQTASPKEIIAAMLANDFSHRLNKEQYGKVTRFDEEEGKKAGGWRKFADDDDDDGQTRLYISIGKSDGFKKSDLADFLSRQLKIPAHHVDKIDMAAKFSLFSLPRDEANELLRISSRDKQFPHVHIDAKSSSGGEKRFGRKNRFDDNGDFRKVRFDGDRRSKRNSEFRHGKFDDGGQKKRRFGRQYKSSDIY
ncbi:MAG: DEAD/DEAH box helicase [Spirochaetaceae bacterium]|nr:DEAD/DEAH box helicase [Spirochaetaceae bacterium]